jgi:hypothetical protein
LPDGEMDMDTFNVLDGKVKMVKLTVTLKWLCVVDTVTSESATGSTNHRPGTNPFILSSMHTAFLFCHIEPAAY